MSFTLFQSFKVFMVEQSSYQKSTFSQLFSYPLSVLLLARPAVIMDIIQV